MYPRCASCHLQYEREPGYFLGSIYINYGLTTMLVTIGYLGLAFSQIVSPQAALWIVTAFAVVFPIWFFRYARSLWLGFDQFWDPQPEEGPRQGAPAADEPVDDERLEDEPWRESLDSDDNPPY